jgi:hypothetical protein
MEKAKLLEEIQIGRAELDALVGRLSDEQLCSPTLDGRRSIKDILVHISSWERRCAGWIDTSLKGGTPERPEPGFTWEQMDELNELTFLAYRNKPLQDVMAESRQSFQRLMELVQSLSEEDLNDIHRFDWWYGRPITLPIAANSYEHYREHAEEIERWLGEEQG